ncbi:MAG: transposase [bacterium]|nr:transposase [bacterium]
MKNRDYKQFTAGEYYHIYNRANNKNNIFLESDDFKFFLLRLKQNLFPSEEEMVKSRITLLPPDSFSLTCYCLMPNHFHFLLRQNGDLPTSKLLSKVCTSYSMYFNKKYKRVGNVLQSKFKQVLIDDNAYLNWLSAYIHQNPKVSGLVDDSADYPWSSYPDFLGLRVDKLCEKGIIIEQFKSTKEYKKFVDESYEIIKQRKELEHLLLDSDN